MGNKIDLKTVEVRDKLKARASKEPYWVALSAGRYLGFRPSSIGGAGNWQARFHDPDTGRKPRRALGDFGTLPPNKRFDAAKAEAEDWFKHLAAGEVAEDVTVREACERYAATNKDAAARFPRYVYNDPVASIKLRLLRAHHVKEWRARLAALPALVTRHKGDNVTRPRTLDTVNRDMVPLRAALNAALARGEVSTALAWSEPMKPAPGVGRRRNLYLDKAQRRALIAELPVDAAAFVRGLCALPLRPGALAALKAGDFEPRTRLLTISRDKAGGGRSIMVPAGTAAMLKAQTRGKLPAAPLFMRADGQPWNKDAWKRPIKDAMHAAGLPAGATAYTLRHSTITDLVTGGLDLLTVAQISGTSVRMIELHYGQLRREHAAEALAGLAL